MWNIRFVVLCLCVMTVAVALLMVSSAFAVSITNGSFEAIQIPGNSNPASFNPADVPGWTHTGALGDGLLWQTGPVCCGGTNSTTAPDGNQFVTLGGGFGPTGSAAWSQTITGLTIGQAYLVDFMMASEATFSGNQSLDVSLTAGSLTPPQTFTTTTVVSAFWQVWEPKQYTFVASATSAALQFSVTNKPFDVGLDAVSIAPATSTVPEPGSLILLGLGLAGLLGYGWLWPRQGSRQKG